MSLASNQSWHQAEGTELCGVRSEMPWERDSVISNVPEYCFDPRLWNSSSAQWYKQYEQGSSLSVHAHETSIVRPAISGDNSEVLSLLAECVGAPVSPESADYHEKLSSHMDDLTVEMYDGQTVQNVNKLKGLSRVEPILQLVRCSVYLSSNNLLSDEYTDRLVRWIDRSGSQCVLDHVLDLKIPTTVIF